jgi:hypothetical protein
MRYEDFLRPESFRVSVMAILRHMTLHDASLHSPIERIQPEDGGRFKELKSGFLIDLLACTNDNRFSPKLSCEKTSLMSRKSQQFLPARKEKHLGKALDKKLAAYVTVATAAGVAMLAAPDAAAEIRYTPVHVLVASGATYWIDFNHDGINDFGLHRGQIFGGSLLLAVPGDPGVNEVVQAASGRSDWAAALMAGAPVGPNQKFAPHTSYAYGGFYMAQVGGSSVSQTFFRGPWKDQINKYLGLKFFVNGELHYGWVRMTVTHDLKLTAVTGFAYETEPNKPIRAGNESGSNEESVGRTLPSRSKNSELATLGMLALGWPALRRN